MAAKYLMFRNAGTSLSNDSGNTGANGTEVTSACFPVSSFLGAAGDYQNKGGSSPHDANNMYVTLFFKSIRNGGLSTGSTAASGVSDHVELYLTSDDGYRAFLEQLFETIENHPSPVLNVFDSTRTNQDSQGIGGRNLNSIAGIFKITVQIDNT
jgi:hypothetical protein|tara:strand:- start:50 stop:511 length:462 start_codon:yes stop_codon:yes gene_type:complete